MHFIIAVLWARDDGIEPALSQAVCTYLEVLVAGLLELLGHGVRLAASEEAGGTEQHTRSTDTQHDVHEDPGSLTRRSLSTGTVRAEGDPVG